VLGAGRHKGNQRFRSLGRSIAALNGVGERRAKLAQASGGGITLG
jgi:hypothetical protein